MRSDDVARTIQSLETAILDRAGHAIAEKIDFDMIDFDILTQLLTEDGWTSVRVNYGGAQSWSRVTEWVDQYFKGRYYEHAGHWAIEQAEDLTLFLLKWQVR